MKTYYGTPCWLLTGIWLGIIAAYTLGAIALLH